MTPPTPESAGERIACVITPDFAQWMSCIAGSILVTTYQAGKVALVGWSGNEVSLLLRDLDKPMGAAVSGDKLAIATRDEILCFANARAVAPHYPVESPKDYDALYLLRTAYRTGDLGVHDVAYGNASVWFVNTLFSCLATTGDDFSFHPRWRPPFIEELSPDDGLSSERSGDGVGRSSVCHRTGYYPNQTGLAREKSLGRSAYRCGDRQHHSNRAFDAPFAPLARR